MTKIIVYATNKEGEGFVQRIGEYDDFPIRLRVGHFAKDIVLTIDLEEDD